MITEYSTKSFLFCLTDPFGSGFQSSGVQIDMIPWKSQPAFGLYDYPAAILTAFFQSAYYSSCSRLFILAI